MTATPTTLLSSGASDTVADALADHVCHGTSPSAGWSHDHLVLATAALVRRHGPAAALEALTTTGPDTHVTRMVYLVWAVDRLVGAGVPTERLLWHPLLDRRSLLCWWDAATLNSDEARRTWVPPTLCAAHEPAPEPTSWCIAA